MTSQQLALAIDRNKKDIAASEAGSASDNVIVQYDDTTTKNDVVIALDKIRQHFIESIDLP